MVRDAANYGAREAAAKNVVDVVVADAPRAAGRDRRQGDHAQGARRSRRPAPRSTRSRCRVWQRALDLLIDPNIIALMLSLGIVGLLVELWNPGLVLPGTVGAISLLVGLYGLQVLPVSVAGVLLLAALARPLRDRRARDLARGAEPCRCRHVRDRRADALRPGRACVPGVAVDRARDRGHARAAARGRALARRRRPAGIPSRSASRTARRRGRPRCGATGSSPSTASSGGPAGPTAGRCRPATGSRSRPSRKTSCSS